MHLLFCILSVLQTIYLYRFYIFFLHFPFYLIGCLIFTSCRYSLQFYYLPHCQGMTSVNNRWTVTTGSIMLRYGFGKAGQEIDSTRWFAGLLQFVSFVFSFYKAIWRYQYQISEANMWPWERTRFKNGEILKRNCRFNFQLVKSVWQIWHEISSELWSRVGKLGQLSKTDPCDTKRSSFSQLCSEVLVYQTVLREK